MGAILIQKHTNMHTPKHTCKTEESSIPRKFVRFHLVVFYINITAITLIKVYKNGTVNI